MNEQKLGNGRWIILEPSDPRYEKVREIREKGKNKVKQGAKIRISTKRLEQILTKNKSERWEYLTYRNQDWDWALENSYKPKLINSEPTIRLSYGAHRNLIESFNQLEKNRQLHLIVSYSLRRLPVKIKDWEHRQQVYQERRESFYDYLEDLDYEDREYSNLRDLGFWWVSYEIKKSRGEPLSKRSPCGKFWIPAPSK